jgi:hypothetical protein
MPKIAVRKKDKTADVIHLTASVRSASHREYRKTSMNPTKGTSWHVKPKIPSATTAATVRPMRTACNAKLKAAVAIDKTATLRRQIATRGQLRGGCNSFII